MSVIHNKKYCLGVRNNSKHTYSMVFQTNYKWLANLISYIYKPLVNEVDITMTENIVIKNNEPPFTNKYLHKEDTKNVCFYIWRGWWQRVGELIYDTWNGAKCETYFPLDESDEYEYESIYAYMKF